MPLFRVRKIAILGVISVALSLSACGGGGDSSSDDLTPPPPPAPSPAPPSIRINEAMSSNALFDDEDGDSPDWIELYNPTNTTISLDGWFLSDDLELPRKWQFSSLSIAPSEYQIVFASDKDRQLSSTYRSLLAAGDNARYIIPETEQSSSWKNLQYDDNTWLEGPTGIGYGDGDDQSTVASNSTSVYLRQYFSISDVTNVNELFLDIDYDDAFVAYINGVEVARANIGGSPPPFDSFAFDNREARMFSGGEPERFDVTRFTDLLQAGENVLAIQVHNATSSSSDLSVIPFLTARYLRSSSDGSVLDDAVRFPETQLHTNFKISATNAETIYLINAGEQLVDSLKVEAVPVNMSLGKNDSGDVVYYDSPTPGARNSSNEYAGAVNTVPTFSHQGGMSASLQLEISGANSDEVIRYTTDGSAPSAQSALLNGPINITTNVPVRAAIFKPNYIPSRTITRTFIVEQQHSLPLVSLVTASENLFDVNTGMYAEGDNAESSFPFFGANFWNDWEKPMHFSYYANGVDLGIDIDAGAKIFGGYSRGNPQRSFSILARGRYGQKEINFPLFDDRSYQDFQSIILRNAGQDWLGTMFRDVLMTGLMTGSGVDVQAAQPTVVYINSEYWGVYNLREKVNEHFIDSRHQVDKDELSIVERNGETVFGDNRHFSDMMSFVAQNDISLPDAYQTLAGMMDIENFLNYQVAQIYFDNHDWPGNNIKMWREQGGKWRWILFDTDFGFNNFPEWHEINSFDSFGLVLDANGPDWPNPPWSTLLLRKLIANVEFRQALINRFADALNSRFQSTNVIAAIDKHAQIYQTEMPAHFARWSDEALNKNLQVRVWEQQVSDLKNFANARPVHLKSHIANYFNLNDYYQLEVVNQDPVRGSVIINDNLVIEQANWTGDYFANNPIQLHAVPANGYRFSHWQLAEQNTSSQIELNLSENTQVIAVFVSN